MSKKILIISSSFSWSNNTKKLCEQFKKGAEEAGNEVELLELRHKKINFCLGCNTCQRNGGTCVYKDGVPSILDKMLEADIIVLATPVYFYSITGQLKTLIDRTYAKFNLLNNKEFYFILSCAAPYEEPYKNDLDIAINSLRGFIKCLPGAIEKDIIIGDNTAELPMEENKAYEKAYLVGKNINQD